MRSTTTDFDSVNAGYRGPDELPARKLADPAGRNYLSYYGPTSLESHLPDLGMARPA